MDNQRTPEARQRLLAAGEILIAEQGYDTVSLRAVAIRAGSRNHSAVNYHFGDRAGLAKAIFEWRAQEIDAWRAEYQAKLLRASDETAIRTWVDIVVTPFVEHVRTVMPDSHYLRFIEQVVRAVGADYIAKFCSVAPAHAEALRRVWSLAPDRMHPAVARRLRLASGFHIHALADFEQEVASIRGQNNRLQRLEDLRADLIDIITEVVSRGL